MELRYMYFASSVNLYHFLVRDFNPLKKKSVFSFKNLMPYVLVSFKSLKFRAFKETKHRNEQEDTFLTHHLLH